MLHQQARGWPIIMTSKRLSTPRILLVDDEAQPLELRAQIMKLHGFSVFTADGSVKALAMMAEKAIQKIQIAVLDYNMPGMNGCALAERLRSMLPGLRIILYTGAVDIPAGEMKGVDALVSKSDGVACLIAQVAQFLRVGANPPRGLASGHNPNLGMASG
jgi:CheY-like chemotaxis protein